MEEGGEEEAEAEAADAAQGHKCLARRLGNNKTSRGEGEGSGHDTRWSWRKENKQTEDVKY